MTRFLLSALRGSLAIALSLSIPLQGSAQGSDETSPVYAEFQQANLPVEMSVGLRQLGEGALGDTISPDTGSLTFRHVDVAVPTNSGLPLEFARIHTVDGVNYQGQLGGWTIDLPYVTARVATLRGWPNRCTADTTRPNIAGDSDLDDDAWSGARMFIPGQGGRLILEKIADQPGAANVWGTDIPQRATEDHWRIDCLNTLRQGLGEALLLHHPRAQSTYLTGW